MAFVHSISGRPPARYNATPWTQARIEESADNAVWAPLDTQNLAPLDADPTNPLLRRLTTVVATLAQGWYRLVWRDGGGNESAPSESVFLPAAADGYVSLDAILGATDSSELIGLSPERQAALRKEAIVSIEAFTGQRFVSWVETKTLDGDGSRRMPLPVRLARLDSIAIAEPSSLVVADLELTDDHDALIVGANAGGAPSWVTRVLSEGRRPAFPAGYGTVKLTGAWGWLDTEMPPDADSPVGIAIRLAMEQSATFEGGGLASQVRAMVPAGVTSVSEGPVSLSVSDGAPEVTLPLAAQQVLADFVWQPVPIGA